MGPDFVTKRRAQVRVKRHRAAGRYDPGLREQDPAAPGRPEIADDDNDAGPARGARVVG